MSAGGIPRPLILQTSNPASAPNSFATANLTPASNVAFVTKCLKQIQTILSVLENNRPKQYEAIRNSSLHQKGVENFWPVYWKRLFLRLNQCSPSFRPKTNSAPKVCSLQEMLSSKQSNKQPKQTAFQRLRFFYFLSLVCVSLAFKPKHVITVYSFGQEQVCFHSATLLSWNLIHSARQNCLSMLKHSFYVFSGEKKTNGNVCFAQRTYRCPLLYTKGSPLAMTSSRTFFCILCHLRARPKKYIFPQKHIRINLATCCRVHPLLSALSTLLSALLDRCQNDIKWLQINPCPLQGKAESQR